MLTANYPITAVVSSRLYSAHCTVSPQLSVSMVLFLAKLFNIHFIQCGRGTPLSRCVGSYPYFLFIGLKLIAVQHYFFDYFKETVCVQQPLGYIYCANPWWSDTENR